MANITLFCGANPGNQPAHIEAAVRLGQAVAAGGHTLVYGGAAGGLMGAAADSALKAGGRVIGILPALLQAREIGHRGLTELRIVASLCERKDQLLGLADAVVALPGGLGTLDELFEAATIAQINILGRTNVKPLPIGVVNVNGYFDHLLLFLERAAEDGLLLPQYRRLIRAAPTPEELLADFGL